MRGTDISIRKFAQIGQFSQIWSQLRVNYTAPCYSMLGGAIASASAPRFAETESTVQLDTIAP